MTTLEQARYEAFDNAIEGAMRRRRLLLSSDDDEIRCELFNITCAIIEPYHAPSRGLGRRQVYLLEKHGWQYVLPLTESAQPYGPAQAPAIGRTSNADLS